ncbi:MAG TPA: class I SAM-dependent methyltransferase [Candidatus Acidoferrales bacterium]
MALDSKERFSNRVDDYVRYRPGYPPAILDVLREECGLTKDSVIADIGSGTGILTKVFLDNGNLVYGVEPNAAMREAAEAFLKQYSRFRRVDGSAEATSLPDSSVDFVTAGQAFHWFDVKTSRQEFLRILKAGAWVVVAANERLPDSPLQHDYEGLLRKYGTDYDKVAATYSKYHQMKEFFGSIPFSAKSFPNLQVFDFEGLRGRLLSASYAPPKGHANHEPMLAELKRVFDVHQKDGGVLFEYKMQIQYGQLKPQ